MNMHVRRWGNSAAVRIPGSALGAARLKIDDPVSVREEDGRIVIEAVRVDEITLETLLAGITPDNLHGEVDFGPALGNEAW